MGEFQSSEYSHSFTIRVWVEELGDGRSEWRGRVQHIPSGATLYFRDWPSLLVFVQVPLSDVGVDLLEK